MNRILTLALVFSSSVALAQPGGDGGKPKPKGPPVAAEPANPYGAAPTDPYAEPRPPPPAPEPARLPPKGKPK